MTYDPELSYELMQRLADNPKNNLDFLPNDNDRYENVRDQIWFNAPQGDRESPDGLVESDFGSFRCEQIDWVDPSWISTIKVNVTRWGKKLDLGGDTGDIDHTKEAKATKDTNDAQNTRIKNALDIKSTTTTGGTNDTGCTKFTKDTGGIGQTEGTIITGTVDIKDFTDVSGNKLYRDNTQGSDRIVDTSRKDTIGNKDTSVDSTEDTGITDSGDIKDPQSTAVTKGMQNMHITNDPEDISFKDTADIENTRHALDAPLLKSTIDEYVSDTAKNSNNNTKTTTGNTNIREAQATEEPKYSNNPHDFLYHWEFESEPYNHYTRGHSDERTTLNKMNSIIGMNQVVYTFIMDDPQYSKHTGCESVSE